MPKIPRINAGDSSAAPTSAAPLAAESVATPFVGLTGLADTAFDVLSAEDKKQALATRAALEQKQAIVNEVEAGRRAGDYEEDLASYSENIKKEFWDAPDKAPAQLLEVGRFLQDRQREAVPNTQVGLEFAQRSNARLAQAVRELHDWALSRQSQKARGDLTTTINRATAGAEGVGSVSGLSNYIAAKEIELTSVFQNVLGSEAQSKMAEMKAGMARAWAQTHADRGPDEAMQVLEALDSTQEGHPLVDNLKDTERETLRQAAKSSITGGYKNLLLAEVKKGNSQNRELFNLTMEAPQSAGRALDAAERALEEQAKVAAAKLELDQVALKKYGLDVHSESVDEVPKLINDRLRYVRALNNIRRTMIGFDAEDDPTALNAAVLLVNKEIKSSKDLALYPKQQADLAVLHSDKKLAGSTFQALYKTMALTLEKAAALQEDPWGPNVVRAWWSPRIAGNMVLNSEFETRSRVRTDRALQNRIRVRYLQQFNAAAERGLELSRKDAEDMALRALALETGERIPGAK